MLGRLPTAYNYNYNIDQTVSRYQIYQVPIYSLYFS